MPCGKFIALLSLLLAVGMLQGCSIVGSGPEPAMGRPQYYTVKPGDSLYKIGRQYNISHLRLAMLNDIRDPSSLQVGQRLLISYRQLGVQSESKVFTNSIAARGKSGPNNVVGRTVTNVSMRGGGAPPKSEELVETYEDGMIAWPVQKGHVVSTFGPRSGSFHDGIDISAPSGTPVVAAHSGSVIYADNGLSGYGNLAIVRDSRGLTTIYAHNRRLLVDVGERVSRGQKIAEVGETGRASGPHLHFEVRSRDPRGRFVAVDPLPLFKKVYKPPRYRVNEGLTPILAKLGFSS